MMPVYRDCPTMSNVVVRYYLEVFRVDIYNVICITKIFQRVKDKYGKCKQKEQLR